jgi:uncharacterized protein YsxB (DUF464 family)
MTKVRYEKNGNQFILTAQGHANYGEKGKDILCSSVSTLVYTLANAVDNMGAVDELILRDGDIRIVASPNDDISTDILETVFTVIIGGFEMLQTKYKDHIIVC